MIRSQTKSNARSRVRKELDTEILRLQRAGLPSKEIAKLMGFAHQTISKRIRLLTGKTETYNGTFVEKETKCWDPYRLLVEAKKKVTLPKVTLDRKDV